MRSSQAFRLAGALLGAWLCAGPAFAEPSGAAMGSAAVGEPQPAIGSEGKDLPWTFKLNGSAGAATVTNPADGKTQIFNTISLQPELGWRKFGLGLDLYLYFDTNGKARERDWERTSDLVNKIWYVRWGRKGEALYARLGGLSGVTLGHGFIMGGYTNRLRYPDVRQVGAVLDFDLDYVGAESVVADVQRATLLGGRAYVRPLRGTKLPLLEGLAFGVSGVTDRDPDSDKGTHDDQVSVYGMDMELPLFSNDLFSSKLYGDAAMMRLGKRYTDRGSKDNGKGFSGGVGGKVLFFDYRAEMRAVDANFVPTFFDGYYELDRSTGGARKADIIPGHALPRRTGPLAQLAANILDKVRLSGTYESLNYDPMGIYPRVRGEARLDKSLFLGKFEAASIYERRRLSKFGDLGRTRNGDSILTTELSYLVGANLRLTAVFKQTYDEQGRPVRTTQLRTDVRF